MPRRPALGLGHPDNIVEKPRRSRLAVLVELLPRLGVFVGSFVLLIFAGCGSSDNSEIRDYFDSFFSVSLDLDRTTEAQLELKRKTDGASDTEAVAALREYFERSIPPYKEFAANYRALHPPEQIRWEHASFVRSLDDLVAVLERVPTALDGADSGAEAIFIMIREMEPAIRAIERSCWPLQRVADEVGIDLECDAFDRSSPAELL